MVVLALLAGRYHTGEGAAFSPYGLRGAFVHFRVSMNFSNDLS